MSLVVTTMFYNDEKLKTARPAQFFLALGLTVFAIVYRVFVTSVLFAITPFWILGIGILVYFINVTVNKATGNINSIGVNINNCIMNTIKEVCGGPI